MLLRVRSVLLLLVALLGNAGGYRGKIEKRPSAVTGGAASVASPERKDVANVEKQASDSTRENVNVESGALEVQAMPVEAKLGDEDGDLASEDEQGDDDSATESFEDEDGAAERREQPQLDRSRADPSELVEDEDSEERSDVEPAHDSFNDEGGAAEEQEETQLDDSEPDESGEVVTETPRAVKALAPSDDGIEGTNVEAIGGEEDTELRQQAASTEAAWMEAGKNVGVQVWHINNEQTFGTLEAVPANGEFNENDAYIVLDTKQEEGAQSFVYTIYFWLGKYCSTDERGVAAYKTVELDDYLQGAPTEVREVQEAESAEFKALFNNAITYATTPGAESGFKIGDVSIQGRNDLYEVQKQDAVLVTPSMGSTYEIKDEFCYILVSPELHDTKSGSHYEIYTWCGASAGRKRYATTVAAKNLERSGKYAGHAKVQDIKESMTKEEFIDLVNAKGAFIENFASGPNEGTLYAIKSSDGHEDDGLQKLDATFVGSGDLKQEQLQHEDVMMLDTKDAIYVWIGSGANHQEMRTSFRVVEEYLQQQRRSPKTPLYVLKDGSEEKTDVHGVWRKTFAD